MSGGVVPLENQIQTYAWGSTRAIAELLGRPNPENEPQAELWIGAHPKSPSRLAGDARGRTLADLIGEDAEGTLGPEVARRFGELPFLLKVIAAAEPLSIQCHPNLDQARAGFAREEAAGIPKGAFARNYRDANHKPELIVALGPFHALKGFRPVAEMVALLREVDAPEIRPTLDALERDGAKALGASFAAWLSLEAAPREALCARAGRVAAGRREPAWEWVGKLAAKYPADLGVIAPLLLNLVTLRAGEAMFLGPGELHAYLEGTGLELMANSDNVLRGGLTPKHVDVRELLAVGRMEPTPPGVFEATARTARERVYETPAPEFELALLDVAEEAPHVSPPGRGVELLLGLEGEMAVGGGGGFVPLGRGQSAFVPAAFAQYRIEGHGRVARASVPPPRIIREDVHARSE